MSKPVLSVVIIGRDEGKRLVRCIESVRQASFPPGDVEVIYVDSNSVDGSPARAAQYGVTVLTTSSESPNPGLARDIGWRAATADIILFLDGDSAIEPEFVARAWHLFQDSRIAIVSGRIREYDPQGSIYNKALSLEWATPEPGAQEYCGGNCLMRRSALEAVGGIRRDLPGGEDADLCHRLWQQGWIVWHFPELMVRHDLAIRRLGQYVRRGFRRGYSFAATRGLNVSSRTRSARSMAFWGSLMLSLLIVAPLAVSFYGAQAAAAMAVVVATLLAVTCWRFRRLTGEPATLLLYGVHWYTVRPLGLIGQLVYYWDQFRGRKRKFIHYKTVEL